jgi:hypothetical protein
MLRGGSFLPQYRRRVAAHHEAGHIAAACLHFGYPISSVEIDDSGNGLVRGALPVGLKHALQRAVVCLSGPAAEARFLRVPITRMLRRPYCRVDYTNAEEHLATSGEPIEAAVGGAFMITRAHWPFITRLADELVEQGRLDWTDLFPLAEEFGKTPHSRSAVVLDAFSPFGRRSQLPH